MFFIPTSVILFVFFWYLSSKENAKAKKESEEKEIRLREAYKLNHRKEVERKKIMDALSPGYALNWDGTTEKIPEKYAHLCWIYDSPYDLYSDLYEELHVKYRAFKN
jgi:hypothetical protein